MLAPVNASRVVSAEAHARPLPWVSVTAAVQRSLLFVVPSLPPKRTTSPPCCAMGTYAAPAPTRVGPAIVSCCHEGTAADGSSDQPAPVESTTMSVWDCESNTRV